MRELTEAEATKIEGIVGMKIGNQMRKGTVKRDGKNLTFGVSGGMASGVDAIQALQEAGVNTRTKMIEGEAPDNAVRGTAKGKFAECWIELRDADGPVFIDPSAPAEKPEPAMA